MKRTFLIAATLIAAAMAMSAQAGTPTRVMDANGAVSYPTEGLLSIEKDTTANSNRVKLKYPSGFQFAADNASWSKYAEFMAGMFRPVAVPTSPLGRVYDTSKAIVNCYGGGTQTILTWYNVAAAELLDDNCAYKQTVAQ